MKLARRAVVASVVFAAAPLGPAVAQAWPDRPVKMIVAFGTGGTIDTLTRILSDELSKRWKQSVVVENKPGGSGNTGALFAAQSAPDGYTFHMGGQPLSANMTLAPLPNLDPVKDFEPVFFFGYAQDVMMVGKDSVFRSPVDVVAEAKKRPGELNYSSLGIGTSGHLATVLLMDTTGLRARHVPYTNVGQMQTDVSAGRIDFWISTLGGQLGYIKGGSLKGIAVSGEQRASELPAVPTFKELGIDLVEPSTWFGVFAPKGTPKEAIARVNADLNAVIKEPAMRARLLALGFTLVGGAPDHLSKILAEDIVKWRNVSKSPAYSAQ